MYKHICYIVFYFLLLLFRSLICVCAAKGVCATTVISFGSPNDLCLTNLFIDTLYSLDISARYFDL